MMAKKAVKRLTCKERHALVDMLVRIGKFPFVGQDDDGYEYLAIMGPIPSPLQEHGWKKLHPKKDTDLT